MAKAKKKKKASARRPASRPKPRPKKKSRHNAAGRGHKGNPGRGVRKTKVTKTSKWIPAAAVKFIRHNSGKVDVIVRKPKAAKKKKRTGRR